MKKWILFLFAILLAVPTWWVFAQENASIEITGANANELPTITINSSVVDSSNRPILGLTSADFTLGGDLAELATITSVENVSDASLPFAIVLVIDVSTSMSGRPLLEAKNAASLFVQSIGDNDPVAIVSFDSDARLVQDYTTDKDLLLAAIDGLYVQGRTALYDAAVLGAEIADAAPVSRRAVILLSDGAEYGGESVNGRDAGLATALELGVPVYTIGLGYGTDRTYLQALAEGTNARTYESPEAEQLTGIYTELAELFRSQYIITLESDIAGDGATVNFTLQANTPNGATNIAEGTFRAPIPVPLISFAEGTFAEPISAATLIAPIIQSDQEITTVTATVDGNALEIVDGAFVLDPALLPPATYALVVTATDIDGDTGTSEASFETAPLPPTVSINGLPDGALTEPITISLDIVSQTPVSSVAYAARDVSAESNDAANGFPFTLDPLAFPAGDYELAVTVTNASAASTTITAPFSVGLVAPRNLRIEGLEGEISELTPLVVIADVQAGASLGAVNLTANGQALENNSIDPINFPAGELELEATVLDSNGQSNSATLSVTIAAVAPRISIGEIPSPLEEPSSIPVSILAQSSTTAVYSIDNGAELELVDNAALLDTNALGNGEHSLTVTVTDENGLSSSESATFVVTLPPTATPTPNVSETAQAELDAQATSNAQATVALATDIAATSNAEANAVLQETLDANATRVFDDEATRNAEVTQEATAEVTETVPEETQAAVVPATDAPTATDEPTIAPSETATDESTATDEPTATATDEPTLAPSETATDEPTATATDEPTLAPTETATDEPTLAPTDAPTLTPIGEIIEVDAQSAPPVEGNLTVLLLVCGMGIIMLILLTLVFFGRRRRGN